MHGKAGVTHVTFHNHFIYTTGRDGSYQQYTITQKQLKLMDKQKVSPNFVFAILLLGPIIEFDCFSTTVLFSTSVESRTEKFRTMPLILTNSYQITFILLMVLSTVTVSVFIEPPQPQPLFGGIFGCFSQKLWAQVSAHLRLSGLDFYVSGMFRVIPRAYFFVWPNSIFGPRGRGQLGVVQNEFLQTWSCYISSESIFDADFEF